MRVAISLTFIIFAFVNGIPSDFDREDKREYGENP